MCVFMHCVRNCATIVGSWLRQKTEMGVRFGQVAGTVRTRRDDDHVWSQVLYHGPVASLKRKATTAGTRAYMRYVTRYVV